MAARRGRARVLLALNAGLRLWLPAENVIAVPWLAPVVKPFCSASW